MLRERLVVRFFAVSGRRLLCRSKSRRKVFSLLEKSCRNIRHRRRSMDNLFLFVMYKTQLHVFTHLTSKSFPESSKCENGFAGRHYSTGKEWLREELGKIM